MISDFDVKAIKWRPYYISLLSLFNTITNQAIQ